MYVSTSSWNSVAIIAPDNFDIVGPGGSRAEAMAAKNARQTAYPPIAARTLKGVILTGASPEESWGADYWRNACYRPLERRAGGQQPLA